ncbi:hypothetical protein D4A47_06530 [Anaerotruncus massiliensis (ex Liu et al. 2021)]|uniref:dihydrouracil dehydrogenase (NAD(+)) n=2 Tax=Anaerotruncus TaxID=244127 RepID=A0A498CNC8_9FIRM|nr:MULTISPECIES: 4Fe-4S binding protein [Anaerotruncus]MBC3938574.1 4Fe-4S binding protein [Anaerotruncus massiliensis (ex Togo et al. 2019)]RLL12184.1 hypothetical protein D4A47_06530 [Anaerotruncus massiliensis (ex Liu et al. 2021)]
MINFCGIQMKNPVVIASSPLTSKLKYLVAADQAGAAAVSTKLTFIRQPFYGKLRMHTSDRLGSLICYDRRLDLEEGVGLIREAKERTQLKIFANMTHDQADMEGWAVLAKALEEAGADAIEANLICPNIGLSTKSIGGQDSLSGNEQGGAVNGQNPERVREIVRLIKDTVKIPVVAKLTPNVTDISVIAAAAKAGGADGVCVAGGQSALPPVDIHADGKPCYRLMNGVSHGSLGGPACRFMSYSQVAQIRQKVGIPLIGGGGLETADQALGMMMWGADLVTVCTSVMWYGWEVVEKMVAGMETYLQEEHIDYAAIVGRSLPHLRSSSRLEALPGHPVIDPGRCIGCGRCSKPGHCDAIEMLGKTPVVAPEKCLGCGICEGVCPTGALTMQQV